MDKKSDGVGCAMSNEEGNSVKIRLHNDCSVYTAELQAIRIAFNFILAHQEHIMPQTREFIILSDSLSSLLAIEKGEAWKDPYFGNCLVTQKTLWVLNLCITEYFCEFSEIFNIQYGR